MGLFNRKNKKIEETKIEEQVEKAIEPVEKITTIELVLNKEEEEIAKYFKLTSNFTLEDLEETVNNIPELYTNEEIKKELVEKEMKLKFYLYKKEAFTNAIKKYYSDYNSQKEHYVCVFDNYGIIEGRKDNELYQSELYLANNHVMFETKKLENNLINAKTKEEVTNYVKKFDSNVVLLLQKASVGEIQPFDEYKEQKNKNEQQEQEIKEELIKLQKIIESLQIKYDDIKKYYFSGCDNVSKEELIKAYGELSRDEKYVKRDSELYKEMTIKYGQMMVSKDIDKVRKLYNDIIKDLLKNLAEQESENKFIYSSDNNHTKEDDDDDATLIDSHNNIKK